MNYSKLNIYNTSICTFQIRKLSNYMKLVTLLSVIYTISAYYLLKSNFYSLELCKQLRWKNSTIYDQQMQHYNICLEYRSICSTCYNQNWHKYAIYYCSLDIRCKGLWKCFEDQFKLVLKSTQKFIKTLMKMAEQRPNWCQLSQT